MTQTRGIAVPTVIVLALVAIGLVVATMLTPASKNPLATQPANAELSIGGASILGSGCTSQASQIKWAGMPKEQTSPPALPGDDPKGTVYVCWTKYRIKDSEAKADYYAAVAESYWTVKHGRLDAKAVASQGIRTSVRCPDHVDAGTNASAASPSCAVDLQLPADLGVACANASAEVCKVDKVLPTDGTRGATWTSANAATLQGLRTAYAEKVPPGTVPTFTYDFTIPQYARTWNDGLGHWEWTAHAVHLDFTDK